MIINSISAHPHFTASFSKKNNPAKNSANKINGITKQHDLASAQQKLQELKVIRDGLSDQRSHQKYLLTNEFDGLRGQIRGLRNLKYEFQRRIDFEENWYKEHNKVYPQKEKDCLVPINKELDRLKVLAKDAILKGKQANLELVKIEKQIFEQQKLVDSLMRTIL